MPLRYLRGILWRCGRGSNPRPPAWQAGILTKLNYRTMRFASFPKRLQRYTHFFILQRICVFLCVFAQKNFLAWRDEDRKILESSFLHQVVVAVQQTDGEITGKILSCHNLLACKDARPCVFTFQKIRSKNRFFNSQRSSLFSTTHFSPTNSILVVIF